jgi:phosphomannomutase
MIDDWQKLKSGSDIRGVAVGDESEIDLASDVVRRIGIAFAVFLVRFKEIPLNCLNVAIGHDSRVSSERIKYVLINSLVSLGVNVCDCGLSSTPAMSHAPRLLSCCAAVEITASHQPKDRNGFKFFSLEGGFASFDIEKILKIAEKRDFRFSVNPGQVKSEQFLGSNKIGRVHDSDIMTKYCEFIKGLIKKNLKSEVPLKDIKIVVDAGGGVGGFFASRILEPLGADISGSVLLEPDGEFSVHVPNPENEKSIKFAQTATLEAKADLGIIFDADVDRAGFINSSGEAITGEKLVALCSALVLREYPNSAIVTDSVTSDHIRNFIKNLGGFQFRHKRGYNNIINAAFDLRKNGINCPLAIETSGHAAFGENNFHDDGAFLAAKIIVEVVKLKRENRNISDLLANLKSAAETKEVRVPLDTKNFNFLSTKIIRELRMRYKKILNCELEKENHEGVRLNFSSPEYLGWCLVRKSRHDPSLVINIQSDVCGGAENIFKSIWRIIKLVL